MAGLGELLAEVGAPGDALVHEGVDRSFTRAEVEASVDQLADALLAAGVQRGQAVAVSLPNGAHVVVALFAVWRIDAVYVPVNPRLSDPEIAHLVDEINPVAVVADPKDRSRFAVDAFVGRVEDGWSWQVTGDRGPEPSTHDPDVALIGFTSGTTGRPKPVLMRHSGVLELLDGVIGSLRTKRDPDKAPMPNLVPVSLSLWAGIYQVLFSFRVGAPVVILPQFTTTGFAEAVQRFGIRSTVLPPAAMAMLSDDESIADLSPLRYVRSISAPLSPLQARRFRDRFGIAVLNGWGQTELGGEIVGWTGADSKEFGDAKLGAVGRPHRGVVVRAVDADGADLPTDEPGELWVRTPVLEGGVDADLADRMSPDGWFRTGDVGRIDADGFVWIEGRVSDMVNRGGLKVFPAEVAEVLLLSPAVADAHVVGAPDDRLGEVPWAFVVPAAGADVPSDQELEALCREHLAPYKVPVGFVTVDALPRNEIGKVLSRDLLSLLPD